MPIIKSAIKRVRQQAKRRSRNLAAKRRIKIASKQTLSALEAKDLKIAQESLKQAISQIDKAVKKGTLHKNTAARRKSTLTRSYNGVSEKAYGTEAATKKAAPAKKPAAKKAAPKKPAAK
ncbi:30S ribosomal protein S20 [bacterium]|nr:30S ribosomal protein S20 [bacterium]